MKKSMSYISKLYDKNKSIIYKSNLNIIILLGIIVIFSSLPIFSPYLSTGHDLGVHLNRIEGIKNALLAGQFPVRMQQSYFEGYGYPISIYYCDLFLYFPAILRILGFSVQNAYKSYVFVLSILTCGIVFGSVKGIFKNTGIGIFASFLFLMSPYRLSSLYLRAAIGEVTAMCFYPLIIYGLYRIYADDLVKEENKNNWLYFSLGFVGLIHCHIISTFIMGLFTLFFCVVFIKKTLERKRIIRLLKSVCFAVLLSAWFVFPFLEYMQYDIQVNSLESLEEFSIHGTFLGQLFSLFPHGNSYSYSVDMGLGNETEMAYSIGGGLVAAIVIFIMCYINLPKKKDSIDKMGNVCFLFGMLALVMTTIWFPWDRMERFGGWIIEKITKSIQYPWRFLSVATVLLVFAAAYTVYLAMINNNKAFLYSIVSSMLVLTFISGNYFMNDYMNKVNRGYIEEESNLDFMNAGRKEYIPVNTDEEMFGNDTVLADENVRIGKVERYKDVLVVECTNVTDSVQYIDVPLLYYKHYQAKDMSTGGELKVEDGEGKRVRVYLPASYQGDIHIEYVAPWYWRIYEIISMITLAIFIMYGVQNRKRV